MQSMKRTRSGTLRQVQFPDRDPRNDICTGYPTPIRVPVRGPGVYRYSTHDIIWFMWREATKKNGGKYDSDHKCALAAERLGVLQDENDALKDENEALKRQVEQLQHQLSLKPEPVIPECTLDALSVACQHMLTRKKEISKDA